MTIELEDFEHIELKNSELTKIKLKNILILKKNQSNIFIQLFIAVLISTGLYFLIGIDISILSMVLLLLTIIIDNFPSKYDQIKFTGYAIEFFKQKSGNIIKIVPINDISAYKIKFKHYNRNGFSNYGIELQLFYHDNTTEFLDLSDYISNEKYEVLKISQELREYFLKSIGILDCVIIN